MATEWEREQRRLQADAEFAEREDEASEGNARIEHHLAKLDAVLTDGVNSASPINYKNRILAIPDVSSVPLPPAQPEPVEEDFLHGEPGSLSRLMPGWQRRYNSKQGLARLQYEAAHQDWQRRKDQNDRRYRQQVDAVERQAEAATISNELLRRHQADAPTGTQKSVEDYVLWALKSSSYPFTLDVSVRYLPSRKELLVEVDYPNVDEVIPEISHWSHVKTRKVVESRPRSTTDRNKRYKQLIAQITLRVLYECFYVDSYHHIEKIAFKGMVRGISPITGRPVRPTVVSYRVLDRVAFLDREFRQVDAYKLLRSLRANISDEPTELKPVSLIVEFDISDPRLIEEEDVLSKMDDRDNLLDLTPQQFETVITNLFNKMGYEAYPTVRAKDGGVDCIAYFRNAVSVFKVVIQAKQWTVPVGVSAIRDLAGAMDHERASQGILVTTCRVTPAGWQFAEGKPMQIIEGAELLDLFEKHTDKRVTIVFPAK